jgi:hypothetical protein
MSVPKSRRKRRSRSLKHGSPRYESLTPRGKSTYDRSVAFLFDLRTGKGPYAQLLRRHHLSSRIARKYLGPYLLRRTDGRVRASKTDRLVRHLYFPMPFGDLPITTRNSRHASKLSEFFSDREKLLKHKMSAREFERKWRGVHIAGQEVFADATEIFRMQNAGILKLENLYASTAPAR